MARILYIFPHPDDESFGPAAGIRQQLKQGHEVFLLTLTRGGATKVRHTLGLTVDQMGVERLKEMENVEKALGLTGMTVLDLPDSGLKDLCPADIEQPIRTHIDELRPDVVVTYAVHGISGFFDHLVTHAVVKSVYCELRRSGSGYPRRLALFTLGPDAKTEGHFPLKSSVAADINCVISVTEDEAMAAAAALDCYVSYLDVIQKTGIKNRVYDDISFEFFQEDIQPPTHDLTTGL